MTAPVDFFHLRLFALVVLRGGHFDAAFTAARMTAAAIAVAKPTMTIATPPAAAQPIKSNGFMVSLL